jgi:hypothetical protein
MISDLNLGYYVSARVALAGLAPAFGASLIRWALRSGIRNRRVCRFSTCSGVCKTTRLPAQPFLRSSVPFPMAAA